MTLGKLTTDKLEKILNFKELCCQLPVAKPVVCFHFFGKNAKDKKLQTFLFFVFYTKMMIK